MEADDECSIQARNSDGVIATIDKDLDQIPGKHYDYKRKVFYEIDPYEAMEFFYKQAITGDATDNIPGAYKMGKAAADRRIGQAVEEIEYDWEDKPEAFESRLWEEVLKVYRESANKKNCPYGAEEAERVALETARLVKLLEYEDQLWAPPGQPDESIQEILKHDNT
jgi:5'-3' exonuclease